MTFGLLAFSCLAGNAQEQRAYPVDSIAATNPDNRVYRVVVLEDKSAGQTMNTIDLNQGYSVSVKGNTAHIGLPASSTGVRGGYGTSTTAIDTEGTITKYRAKSYSSGVAVVKMKVKTEAGNYNIDITVYKDTRCDITLSIGTDRFRYGGALAMGLLPKK